MVATSFFLNAQLDRRVSGRKVDLDYSRYNHEGSDAAGRMTSSGWKQPRARLPKLYAKREKKKKNNAMLYGGRKKKTWLATFGQLIITLEGGFDN